MDSTSGSSSLGGGASTSGASLSSTNSGSSGANQSSVPDLAQGNSSSGGRSASHARGGGGGLPKFTRFSTAGNVAENWKLFKQRWRNHGILTELGTYDDKYQVAMFVSMIDDDALKVYNGFQFSTAEENRTVAEIIAEFDSYALGVSNETYERYMFNSRSQNSGETFESFLASVRLLIRSCNYCDQCAPSLLRDRIVLGIKDVNTQAALLKESKLDLQQAIDMCKAAENAATRHEQMKSETVHKVVANQQHKCKYCGRKHEQSKDACPAYGQKCNACGKLHHFESVCKAKNTPQQKLQKPGRSKQSSRSQQRAHQVQEDTSEDDEWLNAVHRRTGRDVKCKMLIDDQEVVFQLDTGSSVNMLPSSLVGNDEIKPYQKRLRMWNNSVWKPTGVCCKRVKNPRTNKKYSVEFVVFDNDSVPLLSLETCERMNLITVNEDEFDHVALVREDFTDVFDVKKLGELPGTQHLTVDDKVRPVVMPDRRIPVAMKPKLKAELDRLVSLGVIAPVDKPTPWVSQLVVTEKKSGALRVCIDPRELNKALQRERFTLPVLEDSLHELGESRVFSKADLASGYWHVKLDEESSLLTTFQTCHGRFRWLRLPFGTCVSSEIFQKRLQEALGDLKGLIVVADDIVIYGKTQDEHDANLRRFLERCREIGIKLNRSKFQTGLNSIDFLGHRITQSGLEADPEKVRAITEMPVPTNVSELRRFLGMTNYLAKFAPMMSDTLQPLQNLLQKDVPFIWSKTQQDAFCEAKHKISESPTLVFFKPGQPITLQNDASEYGLGSVLLQNGQPIAYASRSLKPAERNYAQIEKEMLAIVFGLEKFHHYTYGATDD